MIPSDRTIAATRFGYGFHPAQTAPASAGDLLDQVRAGGADAYLDGGRSRRERAGMFSRFAQLRRKNRNNALRAEMQAANKAIMEMVWEDATKRIFAPVRSPYGFYERLAWFWADHFSAAGGSLHRNAHIGRYEVDAIRPHIGGRFHDMLRAVAGNPSMLLFLNQDRSVGPASPRGREKGRGLNENLAREIIELHTLGVGAPYRQSDIRQFAELLTGLTFNRRTGRVRFREDWAEPGEETVLGVAYGGDPARRGDIDAALEDLADHPATARHLAWKLARHFVADDPPEDLVASLTDAYRTSRGALPPVYEALLAHPESWRRHGEKVKQPFDFLVSAIRAVDPGPADLAAMRKRRGDASVHAALKALNQRVFQPPGPHGWPEEGEAWITPQGLTMRIRFATALARGAAERVDPRAFLDIALGDNVSDETRFAATRAAERWEGIAYVLASPEFNRR